MAINKDPGDSRTHTFGAIEVSPIVSGAYGGPGDWPAAPIETMVYAVVLFANVIAFDTYDFIIHEVGGPQGGVGASAQKYQPGHVIKRLDADGVVGFGWHTLYAQITQRGA